MADMHLVSHHLCPYVQRAAIVLAEKNIPHRRSYIDLTDKPDWFLAKSPLGRVPILETAGTVLFESQVIAEYLDEVTPQTLHPEDALEKAKHRAWIEFGSQTLGAIAGFYSAPDAENFAQKRQGLRQKFERINTQIAGPYFAGEKFHMIDGVWGTIFRYFDVFDQISEFDIMSGLINVENWRRIVSAHPSVISAAPEDYAERLTAFIRARDSFLGQMVVEAQNEAL